MSTILKALRRLEEEKAASATRPLREEVATPPLAGAPPPRRRLPGLALGAGLVLAIGVGAWTLLNPPVADDAGIAGEAFQRETVVRSAPPPTRPNAPSEPTFPEDRDPEGARLADSGPPAQAFSSPVEVVPRPPVTPRVPIELSTRESPAADVPAEPVAVAAATATPRPAASVVAAAPPPESRDVSEVESVPERAPTPKVAAPASPPKRTTPERTTKAPVRVAASPPPKPASAPDAKPAPAPVQRTAPEPTPAAVATPILRVDKTLWHPQRDRREAVVALDGASARRVHEGDAVGRFVVREIQPSGVVFADDGTTLRRGIGAE